MIMGDFNAKVGEGGFEALVGPYGLGGERLCQFCQEENMKITNTWCKLPPRHLYTWKAPGDRPENIIRNQIDYILLKKRYGTSVKRRVCTYPGVNVPSDHVLLMAIIKIKFMTNKTHVPQRKIDLKMKKQSYQKS